MKNFTFICGAPRSGTTLLSNLIDGHPQTSMFPLETHILEYWNYHKIRGDLERFFLRDYLQTLDVLKFTNFDARRQFEDYMRSRYGAENFVKWEIIDSSRFAQEYLQVLEEDGITLRSIYKAIFKAVIGGAALESKLLIERRPLDNEINAILLKQAFPDAKFIHVLRDPRTCYISAKMRRVSPRLGFLTRQAAGFREKDFATAHAEVSMVTMQLARINKVILGSSYHVVLYEELIKNPEEEMRKIAGHLGLDFHPVLLKQTCCGKEQSVMSSAEWGMSSGVQDVSEKRLKVFQKNTSHTERMILYFFTWEVARYFNYNLQCVEELKVRDLLLPLKYERPEDYIRNRYYMLKKLRGPKSFVAITAHFHKLLNRFYQGMEISGA